MNFTESVQKKSNAELLKMVYEFDQWNPDMLTAVERELSARKILPDDINKRKLELIQIESAQLSQEKRQACLDKYWDGLPCLGFLELG